MKERTSEVDGIPGNFYIYPPKEESLLFETQELMKRVAASALPTALMTYRESDFRTRIQS